MDDFAYESGKLLCEQLPLSEIADRFGTPAYVYSRNTLVTHFRRIVEAFGNLSPAVCFSVKSCSNVHICKLLAEQGTWFDVVSGGELHRVTAAGADPQKVVFAGAGKTDHEIRAALAADIAWFNAESEQELENLIRLAAEAGVTARVALRVNPDVDPKTHAYTTTGMRETKFGVDLDRARAAFRSYAGAASIDLSGLHLHIGSPVNTLEPYVRSIEKTLRLVQELRAEGFRVTALNMGGGYGAHYEGEEAPSASDYAARLVPLLKTAGLNVLLEPGRSIAANAGVLLARVLYVKESGSRRFVIVDAAMNDLLRPALYGAFHFAWPVEPKGGLVPPERSADLDLPGTQLVDIVGGVCETGDFLARDRKLPPVARGDLIAVFSAGAYGFSMSSQYNSRPRAAEVLVEGGNPRLIRRRETYDDLIAAERA